MFRSINNELLTLIIGRLLQVIIMLVTIRISTKYLDANEIGNLYLIVSITSFFGLFFLNPIGQYINRKTHEWYESGQLLNSFYVYNLYILSVSIISIPIIYIFIYFGIAKSIGFIELSLFIVLFIYFNTWNKTIIPTINMLGGRVMFVILTLFTQILSLLLAYVLILVYAPKGIFWFLGQTIGLGSVALVAFIYFVKNKQNNFNIEIANKFINIKSLKNIFKYSAPLSVGVLFLWIQSQSYPLIVEKYIGSEFLGFLGVGMAIAMAISSSFETIITQYIYPSLYKSMKDENEFSVRLSKVVNIIIPIYLFLAIFSSFFAIFIITILTDIKFYDSYLYIIFGGWIAFFRMSSNILSMAAHAKLNTVSLILPYFSGAIISVVGIIYATSTEQYKYLIPAVLICASFLTALIMFLKMSKMIKIDFKANNYYFVLIASIIFLFTPYLYIYSHNILSSILIVSIFGVYFMYIIFLLIRKEGGLL